MSRKCDITGRKAGKGWRYSFLRAHFNPTAKRKFEINLQTITAIIDGKKQKLKVSTKVLKTFPELKSGISSAKLKKGARRRLRNKANQAAA
ncbi:MAG: 50S ribosomal protein L28 [Candidatus Caenarcaniphilales bacterium]|jgi:ribosomal protein L28|nr:50S ribosomal protein L28 [Candidatus Caenarcaniphilales bacterium]